MLCPSQVVTEHIDPASLVGADAYRLMTGIVTPRPIAWVSTVGVNGTGNLAPFSYFQAVCSSPPTIMLSVAFHGDGRPKDTLRNILDRGEFTISHVSEPLAQAMNDTSVSLGPGESEWESAGVTPASSTVVAPPRVADALAAMECRLVHALPVGQSRSGGPSTMLILGEVVAFHLQQGLVPRDEQGRIQNLDPGAVQSVGRMGGPDYSRSTDVFQMPRPAGGKA
jgi:flavin reductase (DIM6/NTAB) family NADH-FMN oxidoreductase RutF